MKNLIFNKKTKHCYVHVPFCNHICTYCDFKRVLKNEFSSALIKDYLKNIFQYTKYLKNKQFKTIYLGGGTPNCLDNEELDFLLSLFSPLADYDCEFTIECNPDLINQEQIDIFKKYGINRISLGVQTTNNVILKQINRIHNFNDVIKAIELLYKNNINNVSCDFIYNLQNLSFKDIDNVFEFIKKYNIKHISFYALEIKSGSLLKKLKVEIDEDKEADQMEYIIKKFNEINYIRYEISNWAINHNYYSQHNLSYWKTNDWIGLGFGAHGFESNIQYFFDKPLDNPKLITKEQDLAEYYQQILIMGLRLKDGLDLNIKVNHDAYLFYKNKLKNVSINEKNHLIADDLNLLNLSIIDLF